MDNELICLSIPNFAGREKEYVDQAIETEWVSTAGSFISDLEKKIAGYSGCADACACQSGTAGLHLCLRHFGIGDGDIVLTPTLTFIAPVNAILYQNAEPLFFDCDEHLCIDTEQVADYLKYSCRTENGKTIDKESGKHVKAILPVHVFGDHCNMVRIMELAEEYHLIVIEDATESLGGTFSQGSYTGRHAGTVGHAGVLSFNGNKIITTGGGGMILSNDEEVIRHTRYLSQQAKDDTLYFVHNEYGYNYRMTNLQAALGLAQAELLDRFVAIKRNNFAIYKERLKDCTYADLIDFSAPTSNFWFYSFALKKREPEVRDRLIRYLQEKNIQARPIWKLNHTQIPFQKYRCIGDERAADFYDRIVNIPCSTNLTNEQIDRVVQALLEFE